VSFFELVEEDDFWFWSWEIAGRAIRTTRPSDESQKLADPLEFIDIASSANFIFDYTADGGG
jgi:hypothetical protein